MGMRGHVIGFVLLAALLAVAAFGGVYALIQVIDRVTLAFQ